MPTLFELLDTPKPQPSPEQLAAGRWLAIAVNIRDAIQSGITVIAQDCTALGRVNVLATMPQPASDAFMAAMPALKALWEAAAPVPFPDLPDQPIPPPPPPPPDPEPAPDPAPTDTVPADSNPA